MHFTLGFGVLLLYSIIQTIPSSLESAAQIHGASRWRVYYRVIFPLSLPGITAMLLMVFNMCMGAFTSAALLGGGKVFHASCHDPEERHDGHQVLDGSHDRRGASGFGHRNQHSVDLFAASLACRSPCYGLIDLHADLILQNSQVHRPVLLRALLLYFIHISPVAHTGCGRYVVEWTDGKC